MKNIPIDLASDSMGSISEQLDWKIVEYSLREQEFPDTILCGINVMIQVSGEPQKVSHYGDIRLVLCLALKENEVVFVPQGEEANE